MPVLVDTSAVAAAGQGTAGLASAIASLQIGGIFGRVAAVASGTATGAECGAQAGPLGPTFEGMVSAVQSFGTFLQTTAPQTYQTTDDNTRLAFANTGGGV